MTQNIDATILRYVQSPNIDSFKRKIKSLSTNEELILFLEETSSTIKETDVKILFLHYAKKLISQIERPIDEEHYRAFQVEYDQDRMNFNPELWINAELEFLRVLHEFTRLKNQPENLELGKASNSPMPLIRHDAMQKLFKWSRTTLNRRIALGLPYHEDPAKAKFFDVNEVNEWIKENSSLMN
ncbi:hypothetical protein [Pedobacter sp.]|uniref:hypothetical protein n=1 Tax=Pedobacter sp. TaxID=1411316 RepID=UPI002D1FB25D|nr:hypothetical protein [Pedobacter sp.]